MATFHTEEMVEYGTNVVAGTSPGKGGTEHTGLPVFDTVKNAVTGTGAQASIVFVPPPFAADAIMEAVDAGLRICVCITDGIPAQDMMKVKRYMRTKRVEKRMTLMGPNCAGVISPGRALLGIMPGHIYAQGPVGIVGRSGTLGYEAASQLKALGVGVSTSVGIGGDPINGSSFTDHLKSFEQDPETSLVVIIGEIGGPQEAEAAARQRAAAAKAAKDQWRHDNPVASAREDPAAERAEWAAEKRALAAAGAGAGAALDRRAAQALLGTASAAGDVAGVRRALVHGADPNQKAFSAAGRMGGEDTAVLVAADGKLHVLRFLLAAAGADPNIDAGSNGYSSSGKKTPCYTACFTHHHDCVRVLLALGAAPDHSTYTYDDKCTCPGDIAHAPGCGCAQCK